MSLFVQVFGCRHGEAIHALRRPASEKRQATKSREVGHRRCRGCYAESDKLRALADEAIEKAGLDGLPDGAKVDVRYRPEPRQGIGGKSAGEVSPPAAFCCSDPTRARAPRVGLRKSVSLT
jgi:hypothetical protein